MPVAQPKFENFYIGIDPGLNGALATISYVEPTAYKMPATERDTWDLVESLGNVTDTVSKRGVKYSHTKNRFAVIEQQIPRPTFFGGKSSILKSTCLLYGNYLQWRAYLTAADIPFEACPPKRWQQALHIAPREKSESDSKWKNRLKACAQRLFPQLTITLQTADSLLICEYCRRKQEGRL